MRLIDPFAGNPSEMATYDEIYSQSWRDALKECERTLERHDHERALGVKSIQDFRAELGKLTAEYKDEQSINAIRLIHPTLDHYETFAENFVTMMAHPVDTSMMWGLLFLVFKLALGGTSPVSSAVFNPLTRITRWLERIGHKLEVSNDCKSCITDFSKVKGDTVEVNKEIIVLWLNIIMTFRNEGLGREGKYYLSFRLIFSHYADYTEMAENHARKMQEMEIMHRLLSLEEKKRDGASLPCNNLPVAENRRFFGRKEILQKLDDHLQPADTQKSLSSLALYGLGGIGKTQIALAYAYHKLEDLDAVFWIPAQDSFSIQQGFSRVAVDALKLPNARPQAYQENMLLVLTWMHTTSAKWLLIFDNVDTHDALDDCWPASKHGAVLVTTRDVLVATLPIDMGLEVEEFGIDDGAEFLLHMASNRKRVSGEIEAARQVSTLLGGLPLALNQMAALINARNCSIEEFQAMYVKHEQRLHKQKKSGWKYLGYQHSLDTVFEMSFENLGPDAPDVAHLPNKLAFCKDEFSLGEALEELTHHALVRKNIEKDTFRIHRLVQSEYRVRMDDRQEQFDAATRLLLQKFPGERDNKYDDDEWILYEKYIPQVLALSKNYADSQSKANPLKANMDFVNLLVNAANGIHDNDTTNSVVGLLDTADLAYDNCSQEEQDRLTWAHLQSLKCMYHFCTSEFSRSEKEMTQGLEIRLEMLQPHDLLLALSYSWLGMAVGAQERNYYCMGRFEEAENLLTKALSAAEELGGWYQLAYAHLTFSSLRTRMNRLDDAHSHVNTAKHILETSGIAARFSWLSSYCAYRAGDVAMKQGRVQDAINETERAATIDSGRGEESEYQRQEARRVRSQIPGDHGDLDDESDQAFERLVKMDHR
ncbi:transcriptional xre family [Colletotrichum asianum]|uniref:Transcriptional xre family n=1 Tax=Colletotrichum asianum TaxID=702518 RepID=A0A8H3WKU9_9PEZI|nr:transcriptional xre family [Colletotrichum asianum]